jgi:hypothetical protein
MDSVEQASAAALSQPQNRVCPLPSRAMTGCPRSLAFGDLGRPDAPRLVRRGRRHGNQRSTPPPPGSPLRSETGRPRLVARRFMPGTTPNPEGSGQTEGNGKTEGGGGFNPRKTHPNARGLQPRTKRASKGHGLNRKAIPIALKGHDFSRAAKPPIEPWASART